MICKTNHIHCTAHGGEARGADNIWETSQHFHPSRIGHGVRSAEGEKLLRFFKNENIHFKVCPTSNIQVNVFDTIENHPVDKIYTAGVSMSIDTDVRSISDVTLSSEYYLQSKTFNWKKENFLRSNLEAINHAFCDDPLKERLKEKK